MINSFLKKLPENGAFLLKIEKTIEKLTLNQIVPYFYSNKLKNTL